MFAAEQYRSLRRRAEEAWINSRLMTKEDVYKAVNLVKKELALSDDPEEFCTALAEMGELRLEIHKFNSNRLGGFIVKNEEGSSAIVINGLLSREARAFCLAHELMHLIFHPVGGYDKTPGEDNGQSFTEYFANEGAAEWILPWRKFGVHVAEAWDFLKIPSDIAEFKIACAVRFSVTPTAVFYRLETLKYEIWQLRQNIEPDKIKVRSQKWMTQQGILTESLNERESLMKKRFFSKFQPE